MDIVSKTGKRAMIGLTLSGLTGFLMLILAPATAFASEANLVIPTFDQGQSSLFMGGIVVCLLGMLFGFYQFTRVKKLRAHKSMLDVAEIIYETCKTYLIQQGKFIAILLVFIGICIAFYFGYLQKTPVSGVLLILMWTVIGIMGSYSVCLLYTSPSPRDGLLSRMP